MPEPIECLWLNCNKEFPTQNHLIHHVISTHQNIGTCQWLNCTTRPLNSLTRAAQHLRTHSLERPFSCRLCNTSFSLKSNCNAHCKARHGRIVEPITRRMKLVGNEIIEETIDDGVVKKPVENSWISGFEKRIDDYKVLVGKIAKRARSSASGNAGNEWSELAIEAARVGKMCDIKLSDNVKRIFQARVEIKEE